MLLAAKVPVVADTDQREFCIGTEPKLTVTHACDGYVERGYGDPRWHRFHVKSSGFGFNADFFVETWLMPFVRFKERLATVNDELQGELKLETIEHDLQLQGRIDKSGHINWTAALFQPAGEWRAQLHLTLEDDQTSLPILIAQVDAIIKEAENE